MLAIQLDSWFICVCVCIYICLSVCMPVIGALACAMQTQCDNVSKLIVLDFDLRILFSLIGFWFKAFVFSHYSMICSPWCPLWEIQNHVKTKFFTAGRFLTTRSCLYHRPGCNMSENMKTRLSKASCHLPVCCSIAACDKGHAMAA